MPLTLPPTAEIEPLEDNLFCRMYAPSGIWKAGSKLIVPDTAREEVFVAKVLKVGPGKTIDIYKDGTRERLPMQVVEGDDILYFRYRGERLSIDGQLYVTLSSTDVIAKIRVPEETREEYFKFAGIGDDPGTIGQAKL